MEIKDKVYYLSGINGIGMSAIAKILNKMGAIVKGSDIEYKPVTKELEEMGIDVNLTQIKNNITDDIDYFVYSTAISNDNPELVEVKNRKIEFLKRGEMLSHIFNEFSKNIAIAGTHGKTTTSSMFAVSLKKYDPYFAIGGIVPEYGNNMRIGKSEFFVAEADESDNSFLYLLPNYSVITNIEMDHIEHHHSFDNIIHSFKKFIDNTKQISVLNYDCENIRKYINLDNDKIRLYSIKDDLTEQDKQNLSIYAKNIRQSDNEIIYDVVLDNKIYEFRLNIPGIHNVSNSLPVIYILYKLGIDIDDIKDNLYKFMGASRRFDILYNQKFMIVDDYGHHPTEIKTTIEATKLKYNRPIKLVFEPHRFTRTHYFKNDFVKSLSLADKVYLLPIYAASEKNEYNISSDDLKNDINIIKNISECYNYDNILDILEKDIQDNDIILFMGAGTITKLAHKLSDKLGR